MLICTPKTNFWLRHCFCVLVFDHFKRGKRLSKAVCDIHKNISIVFSNLSAPVWISKCVQAKLVM